MFCTTIIPTVGRPTLSRAVNSVLSQTLPHADFELVVVNDGGRPLAPQDWQQSPRVQVVNTTRRERSVARNTGSALAKGRYLHFLDDDDWLLPGAFESFWKLAQSSRAIWLYGASQLVDRNGEPLIQLHHGMVGNCLAQVMAGEWIPLQASFIESESFFTAGGFNPLLTGPEDVDLCRRIALRGDFAETLSVVACIGMGEENSTTNYRNSPGLSRRAREEILNAPGALRRMLMSADSARWFGRIARIYLTSFVWNLQHEKPFTAGSRFVFGLVSMALAGRHLLSPAFWRSMSTGYDSQTFIRAHKALGTTAFRRSFSK